MSLAILFHFLCAQNVSDINISIIRSLRLFCWITTLVVLFLVRCVLEFWCRWVGVVSVLQAEAVLQPASLQPNHIETPTHIEPRTIWPMFRCGWVGVVSVLQAEAQLQPATRIPLQPNHTETPTHIEPRTIRPMCFSLQHGYHSNPATPKLQHTLNQEQYDQRCNSTEQSQAPDDGYINVRNMLST